MRRRPSPLVLVVLAMVAFAAVAVLLDVGQVNRLMGEARWSRVAPAVLATLVSYAAASMALVRLGRIVGIERISTTGLLRVSFVSTALSNVFSMGGVSGYPLRTALMGRQGEAAGPVLAMTLVESYLNTTVVASLVAGGMLYLAAELPPNVFGTPAAVVGVTVLASIVGLMTSAALSSNVRARLMEVSIRAARAVLGRRAARPVDTLVGIRTALDEAALAVRGQPRLVLVPVALVVLVWVSMLVAYWFCLEAVNADVTIGVLVTGFAVGLGAGMFSFVPGGLGVQEGSAAGTMALFGVPLGEAVLGAILFRVVYYFVPFFASLPLYWPLLAAPVEPTDDLGRAAGDGS